jgi:hypothetical protein
MQVNTEIPIKVRKICLTLHSGKETKIFYDIFNTLLTLDKDRFTDDQIRMLQQLRAASSERQKGDHNEMPGLQQVREPGDGDQ